MTNHHFFGYGSLVNAATHDYPAPIPAKLAGWRRMWRHTAMRDVAFLTVVPDPACTIEGLLAQVPGNDWAALDQREYAYFRNPVTPEPLTTALPNGLAAQIYQTNTDRDAWPSVRHPILLSYLDVVVQGYLHVFGEEGVGRFFATTSGWDGPVLNDRTKPQYPRHQVLTPDETALVDAHLAALSAHVKDLH